MSGWPLLLILEIAAVTVAGVKIHGGSNSDLVIHTHLSEKHNTLPTNLHVFEIQIGGNWKTQTHIHCGRGTLIKQANSTIATVLSKEN